MLKDYVMCPPDAKCVSHPSSLIFKDPRVEILLAGQVAIQRSSL